MAVFSFHVYKKSPLATVCSAFGTVFAIVGVGLLVNGIIYSADSEEITAGAVCSVMGIAVSLLAIPVNKRKEFKLWKKQLKASGTDAMIGSDVDLAMRVYRSNPGKRTLKYIRKKNPQAAQYLSREIAAKKMPS